MANLISVNLLFSEALIRVSTNPSLAFSTTDKYCRIADRLKSYRVYTNPINMASVTVYIRTVVGLNIFMTPHFHPGCLPPPQPPSRLN